MDKSLTLHLLKSARADKAENPRSAVAFSDSSFRLSDHQPWKHKYMGNCVRVLNAKNDTNRYPPRKE